MIMGHLSRGRPQKIPLRVVSRNPDAIRRTYSDRYRSTGLLILLAAVFLLILIVFR